MIVLKNDSRQKYHHYKKNDIRSTRRYLKQIHSSFTINNDYQLFGRPPRSTVIFRYFFTHEVKKILSIIATIYSGVSSFLSYLGAGAWVGGHTALPAQKLFVLLAAATAGCGLPPPPPPPRRRLSYSRVLKAFWAICALPWGTFFLGFCRVMLRWLEQLELVVELVPGSATLSTPVCIVPKFWCIGCGEALTRGWWWCFTFIGTVWPARLLHRESWPHGASSRESTICCCSLVRAITSLSAKARGGSCCTGVDCCTCSCGWSDGMDGGGGKSLKHTGGSWQLASLPSANVTTFWRGSDSMRESMMRPSLSTKPLKRESTTLGSMIFVSG